MFPGWPRRFNSDEQFSAWIKELVRAWGAFLDTPASAAGIETFRLATNYHLDNYIEGPNGWQTFNQLFARELKSGRRPIAAPRKDLRQAEQVLEALLELRPSDIALALRAALRKGKAFQDKIQAGLDRLDSDVAAEVRKLI